MVRDQLTYVTGWYWPSGCFCDNTAPNPDLLTSVSKRNGLSKSAKANTGASRHAILSISKAVCTSLVYLLQIGVHAVVVPPMQIPWWIASNVLPSPERLWSWCMSEAGQFQPQLSGSPCWVKCPPWIRDGLNSWSHCRRLYINSAMLTGYVLRSVWTQHPSIANAPQFWKRQSYHPSRLNNMLGSIS